MLKPCTCTESFRPRLLLFVVVVVVVDAVVVIVVVARNRLRLYNDKRLNLLRI